VQFLIENSSEDTRFYMLLILLQLAIVMFLGLFTTWNRWWRRYISRKDSVLTKKWTELIVDISLGLASYENLKIPAKKREQEVLQDVLIKVIKSVTADSRRVVINIYKELGFLDLDHKNLNSFFLETQIKSLSNVEAIQDASSVVYVAPLQKSKNFYLRFGAIRFLVRQDLGAIENFGKQFEDLSNLGKYDTLLEIV
jgi:hypothetical protein